MIAINSLFVGLPLSLWIVYPNSLLIASIWPLPQATSIACLIALSTLEAVVLYFLAIEGYNSLVTADNRAKVGKFYTNQYQWGGDENRIFKPINI